MVDELAAVLAVAQPPPQRPPQPSQPQPQPLPTKGKLRNRLEDWLDRDELVTVHQAVHGTLGGGKNKAELVAAVTKEDPRRLLQKVGVVELREYYQCELRRDPPPKAQMVDELAAVLAVAQPPPHRPPQPSQPQPKQKPPPPPPLPNKKQKTAWQPELKFPDRGDQLESYCGNMPDLIKFAKAKHATGGMTNTQVKNWLKQHPHNIPKWLRNATWSVDHIVSDKVGGNPWPHNYFIMPKSDNSHFNAFVDSEKKKYVGRCFQRRNQ